MGSHMYRVDIPRQIGQIIKNKRLEMGLTQVQLANLTNTSRSLLYRLEKGTTNGIMLDKLFEILKALELEVAILDVRSSPKGIQKISTGHDAHNDKAKVKERTSPSRKAADRNTPSRNARTQLDREQEAIRKIRGLNVEKYLKG